MNLKIREEIPADIAAIDRVTRAAFGDAPHASTEHLIIDGLRKAGQLSISLVAEDGDQIIGHVAISPVSISDGSRGWYGLGPISVRPDYQGRGVGTKLMIDALAALRALGARGCVLVGEPAFYRRFGFRADSRLVLPGIPPEYFQIVAFGVAVPAGVVAYHAAFDVHS